MLSVIDFQIRNTIPQWAHTGPNLLFPPDILKESLAIMFNIVARCWLSGQGGGLGSQDPEFKSHSAVELIPVGVDSACHPSEVVKMSAILLVSCVGVVTCPGLYPIAQDTAQAAPTLCTEYGPDGRMNTCTKNNFKTCKTRVTFTQQVEKYLKCQRALPSP